MHKNYSNGLQLEFKLHPRQKVHDDKPDSQIRILNIIPGRNPKNKC